MAAAIQETLLFGDDRNEEAVADHE